MATFKYCDKVGLLDVTVVADNESVTVELE